MALKAARKSRQTIGHVAAAIHDRLRLKPVRQSWVFCRSAMSSGTTTCWRNAGYQFVETGVGIVITAMVGTWLSAPAAQFISAVGAVSVFKAVYRDMR